MTNQEEEFLRTLRAAFLVEADEHLQAISSGLLELEKSPPPAESTPLLENVYRETHSLKGAARAVNLTEIETVCQSLESVLSAWKRREIAASPELFDTLHRGFDLAGRLVSSPSMVERSQMDKLLQTLLRLHSAATAPPPPRDSSTAAPAPLTEKPPAAGTVRIATAKLDRLILQAEEMLSVKLALAQRAADLAELKTIFEQWKKDWAKVSPSLGPRQLPKEISSASAARACPVPRPPLAEFLDQNLACLKSLESKFTALAKAAEQDSHALGQLVEDLVADSKRLLMLPFSTVLNFLPKLVRDLAHDQGKEADLVLRGGEVEIDKRILEEMKDALIHLVRNSVDHGVEKPEERAARHKPPRATVRVSVAQVEGNKVEIVVADDGDGIAGATVRAAALRDGLITEDEARQLSDAEAGQLVFRSGVSTSSCLTEISGRGLGLAIVREKAERLGGHVSVETAPPHGATFRIVLPLTLATFRGIFVQAAGRVFVIPTANVERMFRFHSDEITQVENRETISVNGRLVAFVRLADVLELPALPRAEAASGLQPAVILGASGQRIAFAIDDVLREEEVLIKPLGKPLLRVRNIAAATVLGSGQAVPILNPSDLLKSAVRTAAAPARPVPAPTTKKKLILVVEDSITSRMLLKSILETGGYRVKTAVDGLDAFAQLGEERFDAVVSDVQMPRLSGFELTARIRREPKLATLPVVLVTALQSEEDRVRGFDAGANAYLVKSCFDQSDLLETIRGMV